MATKKKVTNGTLTTIVRMNERENGPGFVARLETPVKEITDSYGNTISEFGDAYCIYFPSTDMKVDDDYLIDWDILQVHESPFTRENSRGDVITSIVKWLVPK